MTEREHVGDIKTISDAYLKGVLTEDEAISFLAPIANGERHFPQCRHGLHSGVTVNGAAMCPLCVVQWQRKIRS